MHVHSLSKSTAPRIQSKVRNIFPAVMAIQVNNLSIYIMEKKQIQQIYQLGKTSPISTKTLLPRKSGEMTLLSPGLRSVRDGINRRKVMIACH